MNRKAGIKRARLGRPLLIPYYFLVPAVAVACAMLLPVFYLLLRAMGAGDAIWELLLRERTLRVLLNTVLLATSVSGAAIMIGVPIAWLTVRSDIPWRGLWSVLTVLPLAIPSLVGGLTFVGAFGQGGLLHQILHHYFGLLQIPDIYGFPGAWAVLTLLTYPYIVLTVRGALRGMDPAQEEAARTLGHDKRSIFRRIILPQLRPSIGVGGLLVALYVLSDFAAVSLLQFESFTWAIYLQYQLGFNRTYAAVLSLVLVGLTLVIVFGEAWTRGRTKFYRVSSGSARPLPIIPLGGWRWPATIFVAGIVGLSALLPFAVNLYWLIRGLAFGQPLWFSWAAVLNSVYVSGIAAAAAVICALPIAVLAVRYPGRIAVFTERAAYVGYALPGIVVALALVFFGANYAFPLYQTLAMLIMAYVVLFLPQALGAIRNSLLQISPNVENAARSLGYPPWKVMWRVTLPLIRPGLVTAATLVFLTVIKELPATLLLSPIGFHTLATQIWAAAAEAYYTRAAAAALILILASSVSVGIILHQEGQTATPKRKSTLE